MNKLKLFLLICFVFTVVSGCRQTGEQRPLDLTSFQSVETEEEQISQAGYRFERIKTSALNPDLMVDLAWASPEQDICAAFQNEAGDIYFSAYEYETKTKIWEGNPLDCAFFLDTVSLDGAEYGLCANWSDDTEDLEIILTDIRTGETVNAVHSVKLPFYCANEDKLYLTITQKEGEKTKNILAAADVDGGFDEIETFESVADEQGLYTGQSITAMGGVEGILYLQISSTEKELLEKGDVQIIQYDLAGERREKFAMDIPAEFVSGDNQIMLVSQHGVERPIFGSGVIYDLQGKKQSVLQDVSSGNDISYMDKGQGRYWFGANQQVYAMDEQTKEIQMLDKQENMGSYSLKDGCFSYLYGLAGEQEIAIVQPE